MKRLFLLLAVLVAAFAAALTVRALTLTVVPVAPPPADPLTLDDAALAARLSRAIKIPTISHQEPTPDEHARMLELHALLRELFPRTFSSVKEEIVANGSLLLTWQGSEPTAKPILLLSHMDVVPISPGTEKDWEQPPFSGALEGGFIWGRGALDDKVGVLGILEAVEHLVALGVKPRRTVILAFGHDEEVLGNGAKAMAALLAGRGVEAEFVLDEGGVITLGILDGVSQPAAVIGITEKGYMSVELTVEAAPGHSSFPPRETAIGRLSRAITSLEANPMPYAIGPTVRETLITVAPAMDFLGRLMITNLWLFEPLLARAMAASDTARAMLHTTMATTIFQSGDKDNVLPGRARAIVNLRLIPGDTRDAALARMTRAIDDPGVRLTPIDPVKEASPVSDPQSPVFKTVAGTVRQVFPDALAAPFLMIGATDAAAYTGISANVYRFLPVRWAPEDQKRFHGTNERVSVRDYAGAVRYYAQLIRNTAL